MSDFLCRVKTVDCPFCCIPLKPTFRQYILGKFSIGRFPCGVCPKCDAAFFGVEASKKIDEELKSAGFPKKK